MIEVFLAKDYNETVAYADACRVSVQDRSRCMVMQEGGDTIGIALWTAEGLTARIYKVCAPDSYGEYYDLLFRSTINYLMDIYDQIVIDDNHEYYIALGFAHTGDAMTAKSKDIKFPHNCGGGK